MTKLSRREFIKQSLYFILTGYGITKLGKLFPFIDTSYARSLPRIIIADCSDRSIEACVKAVIDKLGGIRKFVKKGSKVVIKPNISFARPPRFAATTLPEIVHALVKLCEGAGAKEIIVVDYTVEFPAAIVFRINKISSAIKGTSAKLINANKREMYKKVKIGKGKVLKEDEVLKDVLECDTFINVPIAKHHATTEVTLSMKNLMGIIWDRGRWHKLDLHQCIADFATFIKPHLIIMDATRVLLSKGPRGVGGEVKKANKILASLDLVAIDSYVTKEFFNKSPQKISHINLAYKLGVGEMNLDKVEIIKC